jgi:hypothetical protein
MAKVKIDKELHRRATEMAAAVGYSSVDEFVEHLVERALRDAEPAEGEDKEAVEQRLKGLGYID